MQNRGTNGMVRMQIDVFNIAINRLTLELKLRKEQIFPNGSNFRNFKTGSSVLVMSVDGTSDMVH